MAEGRNMMHAFLCILLFTTVISSPTTTYPISKEPSNTHEPSTTVIEFETTTTTSTSTSTSSSSTSTSTSTTSSSTSSSSTTSAKYDESDDEENSLEYVEDLQTALSLVAGDEEEPLFSLVNEDGSIVEGEQLGLLLYNGGTVCWNEYFDKMAAYAVCRELGYEAATSWSKGKLFDNQTEYEITLEGLKCIAPEWEGCKSQTRTQLKHGEVEGCQHSDDVFLSCSGGENDQNLPGYFGEITVPAAGEIMDDYCEVYRNYTNTAGTSSCFISATQPRGCCKKGQFCCGNSHTTGVCCHSIDECHYDKYEGVFYCHHNHWACLTSIPAYWLLAVCSYLVLSRKLRNLRQATVVAHTAVQYTANNPQYSRI